MHVHTEREVVLHPAHAMELGQSLVQPQPHGLAGLLGDRGNGLHGYVSIDLPLTLFPNTGRPDVSGAVPYTATLQPNTTIEDVASQCHEAVYGTANRKARLYSDSEEPITSTDSLALCSCVIVVGDEPLRPLCYRDRLHGSPNVPDFDHFVCHTMSEAEHRTQDGERMVAAGVGGVEHVLERIARARAQAQAQAQAQGQAQAQAQAQAQVQKSADFPGHVADNYPHLAETLRSYRDHTHTTPVSGPSAPVVPLGVTQVDDLLNHFHTLVRNSQTPPSPQIRDPAMALPLMMECDVVETTQNSDFGNVDPATITGQQLDAIFRNYRLPTITLGSQPSLGDCSPENGSARSEPEESDTMTSEGGQENGNSGGMEEGSEEDGDPRYAEKGRRAADWRSREKIRKSLRDLKVSVPGLKESQSLSKAEIFRRAADFLDAKTRENSQLQAHSEQLSAQLEQLQADTERLMRAKPNNMHTLMLVDWASRVVVFVDHQWEIAFGRPREAVIGRAAKDLPFMRNPVLRAQIFQALYDLLTNTPLRTHWQGTWFAFRGDGQLLAFLTTIQPVFDASRKNLLQLAITCSNFHMLDL